MAKKLRPNQPQVNIDNPGEKPAEMTTQMVQPTSLVFDETYFEHLRQAGLDVAHKGAWQKMFAHFIDTVFPLRGKTVLDLGCAMGAQSSSFADYGIDVYGVDISSYAIERGKKLFKNVKHIQTVAWDLSEIPDNSIDFCFSMFMFNHIPEDKCKLMFQEIKRVCKKDALLFSILHITPTKKVAMLNDVLYPKVFWDAIAQELNMLDGARSYFNKLINAKTPGWEFMKCYNWAYLLYKVQKEV